MHSYLCAFLELADDDIVDSDYVVRELENIAAELQQSSPEEKAALKSVLRERYLAIDGGVYPARRNA